LAEELVLEDTLINDWSERIREIAKKFKSNQNLLVSSTPSFYNSKNFNISKWSILDSYIHMTNNRLGILPRDELYIYYILGEFFLIV
jgi:hypothetical protein